MVSLITITGETTAGITKWGISLMRGVPFLFNDDDNGNNKVSTKSVLQLRFYSEVMCIFVLYLVEYRLFRLF